MTPSMEQNKRDTFSNLQLNLCTSPFVGTRRQGVSRFLLAFLPRREYQDSSLSSYIGENNRIGNVSIQGTVDTLSIAGFQNQFPQAVASSL